MRPCQPGENVEACLRVQWNEMAVCVVFHSFLERQFACSSTKLWEVMQRNHWRSSSPSRLVRTDQLLVSFDRTVTMKLADLVLNCMQFKNWCVVRLQVDNYCVIWTGTAQVACCFWFACLVVKLSRLFHLMSLISFSSLLWSIPLG